MTKFWLLMGGIFFGVGIVVLVIFCGVSLGTTGGIFTLWGAFILLPLLFVIIGAVMLGYAFNLINKKSRVKRKGTRYTAKIYGYVPDTSFLLNGQFTVNLKVHFFDRNNIEREAVLATNLPQNTNKYGIGMTIDIFEYNGQYEFDENSLRYEVIRGEAELMDDMPVMPEEQVQVGIMCPTCGASFRAVKGYANKCPYCNGYINA